MNNNFLNLRITVAMWLKAKYIILIKKISLLFTLSLSLSSNCWSLFLSLCCSTYHSSTLFLYPFFLHLIALPPDRRFKGLLVWIRVSFGSSHTKIQSILGFCFSHLSFDSFINHLGHLSGLCLSLLLSIIHKVFNKEQNEHKINNK